MENYLIIGAALVASFGGISDLRSARIPNWLTYSSLLTALILRFILFGWLGFKSGFQGMMAAGIIFFILFVIGAMGAGDVKLIAAVGAWVGADQIIFVLVASALGGGLLAVMYMIFVQGIWLTLWNLLDLIRFRLTSGLRPHPVLNVREGGSLHVPFGVAIAMATLFCAGNVIWWR